MTRGIPAAAPQLRIHSGTHAGAHEALAADSVVLGAANDCDFVLADAGLLPRHARLSTEAAGHRLQLLDGPGSGASIVLAPGALHRIGPVLISVDAADAPWPDAARVQAALDADAPAPPQAGPAVEAEDVGLVVPVACAPDPAPELSSAAAPRRPRQAWLAALLLLPVGALLWAVWSVVLTPAPRAGAAAAPASPVAPASQREAVQAVLRTLNLGSRASVAEASNGRLTVRATLLDDEDYERLAAALSRLRPRPGLAVTTEQDLQAAVAEAVAREAAELGTALTARPLGGGRFRLEGVLAAAPLREALLARLRRSLPPPIVLESALSTGEERAQRLLAELREAGIGEIQGRLAAGELQVDALLAAADVPRWEQVLVRIARRYPGVAFSVTTRLRPVDAPNRLPAVLATLPFRLRSVVSGPTPYVVLNDGAKLMLGGSRQGWRLAAVEPASVVFESQGGRRALVPR